MFSLQYCIGTVILLLMIILTMVTVWRVKCHLSSIHPRSEVTGHPPLNDNGDDHPDDEDASVTMWSVIWARSIRDPRWPEPGAGFVPSLRILIQTQAKHSPTNFTFFSVSKSVEFVGPLLQIQTNQTKNLLVAAICLNAPITIKMVASCLTEELTWCSRRCFRFFWDPQLLCFGCPCILLAW